MLNCWASPESSRGTSGGACRSPSAGEAEERAEAIGNVCGGDEGTSSTTSALSKSKSSCVRFGSSPEVGEDGSIARGSDTADNLCLRSSATKVANKTVAINSMAVQASTVFEP